MGVSGNSQWVVACWLADGDATAPLGYLVHPPSFFYASSYGRGMPWRLQTWQQICPRANGQKCTEADSADSARDPRSLEGIKMVRLFEDCFVSVLLIRIHYIYISVAIWLKGSTLGAPGRQGLPGMAGLVTPQASQVLAGTPRPCLLPHGSTPRVRPTQRQSDR